MTLVTTLSSALTQLAFHWPPIRGLTIYQRLIPPHRCRWRDVQARVCRLSAYSIPSLLAIQPRSHSVCPYHGSRWCRSRGDIVVLLGDQPRTVDISSWGEV